MTPHQWYRDSKGLSLWSVWTRTDYCGCLRISLTSEKYSPLRHPRFGRGVSSNSDWFPSWACAVRRIWGQQQPMTVVSEFWVDSSLSPVHTTHVHYTSREHTYCVPGFTEHFSVVSLSLWRLGQTLTHALQTKSGRTRSTSVKVLRNSRLALCLLAVCNILVVLVLGYNIEALSWNDNLCWYWCREGHSITAVSYTHLTLPTIYSV